ncbi:DUF6607 family protein [Roseibacillus persicicus]|uniref:Secreted protein n=1 Tax=Roseibacillus persicicus TaxID=454148 RepID=A0A918TS82_9BACT|nr:DUF6607 family protein [Roseibacillus persicicus]GHC61081.1 hypothetical protein GCM10007100_30440 [Roseibacillus persicicus]
MKRNQFTKWSTLFAVAMTAVCSAAPHADFDRDRAAILSMAGTFEVEFKFEETVPLQPDYELKDPYKANALELVKVAEDLGSSITLQHLLIVEDMDGPRIIKHWAQIWNYEDTEVLTYEGKRTWLPVELSEEEVKGTWTQLVTQVDDSPRYKAAGKWEHSGDFSEWTSDLSTRPLPRREYTKRSDYDRLQVINRHLITPEGWVHLQDNRKQVRSEGQNHFLCLESGANTYKRIVPEEGSDQELGVKKANEYWAATHPFWKNVRHAWTEVIAKSEGPVHYISKLDKKPLMARMSELAENFKKDSSISRPEIDAILTQHLR